MAEEEKRAFQAAGRIRNRLENLSQERLAVHLPTDYWETITKIAHQIEIASAHGWHRAARSLRTDLARSVDYCRDRLAGLFNDLDKESVPIPSLSTLYHEILAIYQEFEEAEIDFEEGEMNVTTEFIRLEGISLGPFKIRLNWENLGKPSPYLIKALDPHPAAANDAVTHPHVQDERLCEGEGRTAIRNALREGRLGDFFLLVAQVLRTYGKGSAYIELDDWEGVCCSDCGGTTFDDERSYCNRCDATLCDPCARTCSGCDCTYCSDCLESCAVCDESFCSSCLTACKTCHQHVCQNCLTNGVCEKYHEKRNTPDDHEADDNQCAADIDGTKAQTEPLAIGV